MIFFSLNKVSDLSIVYGEDSWLEKSYLLVNLSNSNLDYSGAIRLLDSMHETETERNQTHLDLNQTSIHPDTSHIPRNKLHILVCFGLIRFLYGNFGL